MSLLKKIIFKNAPRVLLGAFFLCSSCQPESPVPEVEVAPAPDRSEEIAKLEAKVAALTADLEKAKEIKEKEAEEARDLKPVGEPLTAPAKRSGAKLGGGTRFLSYNLKNYLTMEQIRKGGVREKRPKPEMEIAALVEIIVNEKPDILGVCEIGERSDLEDLQTRLKKAGLDLPHLHHAGGFDEVRHLGILSRLPIAKVGSEHHLPFEMNGEEYLMRRGILDVTIELPGGPTHFVGMHLKSKRPNKSYDEAELRLNEARLARKHVERILEADPAARVVMYGDMNDTRKTPPLSAMMGRSNWKNFMADVYAKDSRGEVWTHFWSWQQQYARFDFVLISRSLKEELNMDYSYVADPPNWFDASDHRAVMVTFGK